MELKNRIAVITGAARGIGKATAKKFATEGAALCLMDVDRERLLACKEELCALGSDVSCYVCDLGDEAAVLRVAADIIKQHGYIDILVNNAGIWREFKPFVDTSCEERRRYFDINVVGTLTLTQALLPSMIQRNYGRIINIGSVAGTYGIGKMVTYSATKGAISAFTKALAKEVAPFSITVNNVCPGNAKNEGSDADNLTLSYLARSGDLWEYAELIAFLAGDRAAYISGQDYIIDGCRKKL